MLKFGKKSKDILEVKKSFITENKSLFKWQRKLYKLYSNQPKENTVKTVKKKLKVNVLRSLELSTLFVTTVNM